MCAVYQNPAGWTVVDPAADTKICFVDATAGNDGTAVFYDYDDALIGADPYNPVGPINAYQTIDAAKAVLRAGMADWLLLKKGETWSVLFGALNDSGRSVNEPMLIGAYGTGARPRMSGQGGAGIAPRGDNLVFLGLHLEPANDRVADEDGFLIDEVNNLLIEDCYIRHWGINILMRGQISVGAGVDNVMIRRNVILDSYGVDAHSHGIFHNDCTNVTIEENWLDHNGWDLTVPGARGPTIFSHNAYVSAGKGDNSHFYNNLSIRPSHMCFKLQPYAQDYRVPGMEAIGNVMSNASIGIQLGTGEKEKGFKALGLEWIVRDNVIIDINGYSGSQGISWPVAAANVASMNFLNNVIARAANPAGSNMFGSYFQAQSNGSDYGWGIHDVTIDGNVFFNCRTIFQIGSSNGGGGYSGNVFTRNVVQSPFAVNDSAPSSNWLIDANAGADGACAYSFNRYYSSRSDGKLFKWANTGRDFATWESLAGDTGSAIEEVTFTDSTRSCESYMDFIEGDAPGTNTIESFAAKIRQQSRDTYDENYLPQPVASWIRAGFDSNVAIGPAAPTNLSVAVV